MGSTVILTDLSVSVSRDSSVMSILSSQAKVKPVSRCPSVSLAEQAPVARLARVAASEESQ